MPWGVAVIELDAPGRLDAELSRDHPADPGVAAAMMCERMATPELQETGDSYANSYLGLAPSLTRKSPPWWSMAAMWSTANRTWPRR